MNINAKPEDQRAMRPAAVHSILPKATPYPRDMRSWIDKMVAWIGRVLYCILDRTCIAAVYIPFLALFTSNFVFEGDHVS